MKSLESFKRYCAKYIYTRGCRNKRNIILFMDYRINIEKRLK